MQLDKKYLDQKNLIGLMEQWYNTSPLLYKKNIKKLCDNNNIKPRHLKELMQVPINTARSYTNIAHTARIEFIAALRLAELLEVQVTEFLREQ